MVLTLKATGKATIASETYLWTGITEYVREICKNNRRFKLWNLFPIKIYILKRVYILSTTHLEVLNNSFESVRSIQIEWNLDMMVFEERGNPGYPGKKPLDAWQTTTNSTHIFRRRRSLNRKNCVECWKYKMFARS